MKVETLLRSDEIDDLVWSDEPIHRSTRDDNIDLENIPTLRINVEEKTFVPLYNVAVEAWIHTFAADITLTQTFINLEDKPIEAIYVFPIEENAAVYALTVEIDDRLITAEIKRKKVAEAEYNEAIIHGQTATLLRQSAETLDTFIINVGAIPPGKECRVMIRYVTELDLIDGKSIRFVVPSTIAPRYNPELGHLQSPDNTNAEYVQSTPYTISFQIHVERNGISRVANLSHPVNVSTSSELINISTQDVALDRDFIIDIHLPRRPPSMLTAVEQYDSTKYAALTALIPHNLVKSNYMKSEFIFIVDCSGSMETENKIGLAREAMLLFIRSLPLNSYFNIIRFGSHYQILFESEMISVDYNEETAKQAESLSYSMKADFGGTELLEPLQYLKNNPPTNDRSRQVFILTDGEVSNTNKVIELCRSMSSTTRIFTFGLGHSPSRSLVKGLARATNGHFVFIPPGEKVDTYVGSQLRRALKPSIVNARLEWHGLSSNVAQSPDVIPPLYANDRVLVYTMFENDEFDQQTVQVNFRVRCKKIDSTTFALDHIHRKGDTIRRLAAKAMIQQLQHMRENDATVDDMESIEQRIIALSLAHQILSPYTAFVGVETTTNRSDITAPPEQSFNGAWQLTDDDIQLLTGGKTMATFKSNISDMEDIITTAIAIAVLESKYASQQDLWHAVVDKARQQMINFGLTQDNVDLLINEIKNKL
ncbi:unnamed protein product [Rotaria sordida]|uniref:Uncharacterized protein n=2 Tax=Rotaria sordida TaxID=392033 RepID=A0A814BYX9_9BILA|nr:unnamed protein product [Rotaria sordida]